MTLQLFLPPSDWALHPCWRSTQSHNYLSQTQDDRVPLYELELSGDHLRAAGWQLCCFFCLKSSKWANIPLGAKRPKIISADGALSKILANNRWQDESQVLEKESNVAFSCAVV
jgi:hypothetical protein